MENLEDKKDLFISKFHNHQNRLSLYKFKLKTFTVRNFLGLIPSAKFLHFVEKNFDFFGNNLREKTNLRPDQKCGFVARKT